MTIQAQKPTGAFIGAAAVILDPRITVHTPDRLWLSTGVRAVDHAVEALCSVNAQPLIDATSVRALMLLGRSLKRYATDPSDLAARLMTDHLRHIQEHLELGSRTETTSDLVAIFRR